MAGCGAPVRRCRARGAPRRCGRSRVRPSASCPRSGRWRRRRAAPGARAAGLHPWATGRCCPYTRRGCPSGSLRWSVSVWIPKLASGLRLGTWTSSEGDGLAAKRAPRGSRPADGAARARRRRPARRSRRSARGRSPGIKVVELGVWIAGPATGGILADWGADVVKIEGPDGDPARRFMNMFGGDIPFNPPFELDNRSKRSIVIDLANPVGLAVAHELIDDADVFLTQRPTRRARTARPRPRHAARPLPAPRLLRGHGLRRRRARSATVPRTTSARSGPAPVSRRCSPRPNGSPPFQRGGMGDHGAAMAGAAAVCAALVSPRADREGPARVDVAAASRRVHGRVRHQHLGAARAAGRDRHALDDGQPADQLVRRPRRPLLLAHRPRGRSPLARRSAAPSATPSGSTTSASRRSLARRDNCRELIGLLDEIFATATREEWGEAFDRENVWWAPVQTVEEVLADPQFRAERRVRRGARRPEHRDDGRVTGRLRGHAVGAALDAADARRAHRRDPRRARPDRRSTSPRRRRRRIVRPVPPTADVGLGRHGLSDGRLSQYRPAPPGRGSGGRAVGGVSGSAAVGSSTDRERVARRQPAPAGIGCASLYSPTRQNDRHVGQTCGELAGPGAAVGPVGGRKAEGRLPDVAAVPEQVLAAERSTSGRRAARTSSRYWIACTIQRSPSWISPRQ